MGSGIGVGVFLLGFALLVAAIVLMVRWFLSAPGRALLVNRDPARNREMTRSMYSQAWPLLGAAGLFLIVLGAVINGEATPLRMVLLFFAAAATGIAAGALYRLRLKR